MLVLSRHEQETIRIGDDIVISIQRISGNRVVVGIEAPREVRIVRGELLADVVESAVQTTHTPTQPLIGSQAINAN